MERVTGRDDNGIVFLVCRDGCRGGPACFECERNAINRLAAYEDTGLTPEEVTAMTIQPPNDPLTLEELREIVKQLASYDYEGKVGPVETKNAFVRLINAMTYRRKPEGTL